MSFSDLHDHLSDAFYQPHWSEDITLRNNVLDSVRQKDRRYRDRIRHQPAYRTKRAAASALYRNSRPGAGRALCSRVWREVEEGRREDRRAAWIRREAVYHELRLMRGRTA